MIIHSTVPVVYIRTVCIMIHTALTNADVQAHRPCADGALDPPPGTAEKHPVVFAVHMDLLSRLLVLSV